MEGLLSTGPTPSSLLLEAPLLLVWAWRRRKGRGGIGGLNRLMNDNAAPWSANYEKYPRW